MTLVTTALGHGFPTRSPHLLLQARKLQRLLPHIMGRLQDAEDELRIKALLILRNVMGHLPREEASPIAVGLLRDLRLLLDGVRAAWAPGSDLELAWGWLQGFASHQDLPHVPPFPPCLQGCSRLRELSIRLLRFLLESVLGGDRRRMRSKTWDLLLPLFFRMSDQSRSVAEVRTHTHAPYPTFPRVGSSPRCRLPSHPVQASREALLAAATLLGWEELRRLLETRQKWRVAECLVWALHPSLFPLEPLGLLCPSHIGMGKGALGLLQPMGGSVASHSLCSWSGAGRGLRDTCTRACSTWRMLRSPCKRQPSGSLVSTCGPHPGPHRCIPDGSRWMLMDPNGSLCPGLAARPLRGKSPRKLEQICRGEEGAGAGGMLGPMGVSSRSLWVTALEVLLEKGDPGLRSLAAQTVLILRSPPAQRSRGCRLRALCCWEWCSSP